MDIFATLDLSPDYGVILLVNLGIAFALLVALKFISGAVSNVNAVQELAEKDNPAFGVSMAGVALAVTIMMSGVMTGGVSDTVAMEALAVGGYGVLGLALMMLTRFIFDRVSMPGFSVRDEILKGNIAAGLVDAGNVIATAIIIRAAMIWIDDSTLVHGAFVVGAYVLSQAILTGLSIYKRKVFQARSGGASMQEAISGGNMALAWQFTGQRLGTALAISAASGLVPFSLDAALVSAGLWVGISLVMMVLISVLTLLADAVILHKIDVMDEVHKQRNIAVGVIQCAVIVSVGLIIATLSM